MATGQGNDGLACPECGSRVNEVLDSRSNPEATHRWRRRRCENGHRFTTYETTTPPPGVKRGGPRLKKGAGA